MNSKKWKVKVFCLGHRFSKHKMTKYAKHLGGMAPLATPGYAYAPCSNLKTSEVSVGCCIEESTWTLLGLFGAPRNDSARPWWFGAQVIVPPRPSSLRPCHCYLLPFENEYMIKEDVTKTRSSNWFSLATGPTLKIWGAEAPLYFFRYVFSSMVPDTETSIGWFFV